MIPSLFSTACTTCRVTMIEAGGDAAGWSILFLLVVILTVLVCLTVFLLRIARREREHLDPSLCDDYVPVRVDR